MSDTPKRDVSARKAIGTCDCCGGNAHSTIGGEHIFRCSEVVPKAAVESLIEEWRERGVEEPYGMTWHPPAEELEELIDN